MDVNEALWKGNMHREIVRLRKDVDMLESLLELVAQGLAVMSAKFPGEASDSSAGLLDALSDWRADRDKERQRRAAPGPPLSDGAATADE